MSGQDVMPLPPDTRTATDDLAEELKTVGQRISNTEIASDTQKVVDGWSGQTAAAHIREVRALGQKARELAEKLPQMEAALTPWSEAVGTSITTTVPALWTRYDDAQDAYTQSYNELKDEIDLMRRVGEPLTQAEIDAKHGVIIATRDSTQQTVLDDYKKAMDTLDEAAATAARALQGVMDSIVPPEAAEGGRAAVGAALFDDMPTVDGVAEWNYAQEQASEAARDLREIDDVDDMQAFADKYGDLLNDPFFARAFAEEVSAEEMMRHAKTLANFRGQGIADFDDAMADEMIAGLGGVMVLASGGSTIDPGMAAKQEAFLAAEAGLRTKDGQTIEEITDDFNDQLTQMGRTIYDTMGEPITDPAYQELGYGGMAGYEYITWMLDAAGRSNDSIALGPEFLEQVAPDIVAWDHEMLPLQDLGIMGYERLSETGFDHIDALMRLMDEPEGMENASEGQQAAERIRMSGVRDFLLTETTFDADPDTDGHQTMNMTKYLTGHRMTDRYAGTDDMGESFGRVLAQATAVDERPVVEPFDSNGPVDPDRQQAELDDWLAQQAKSAEIAGNFLVGYQDGLDYDGADLYRGEDGFGRTHAMLRSWAGVILAPHMEGIADSLHRPDDAPFRITTSGFGTDEAVIKFDDSLQKRLLNPKNGMFVDLAFDNPLIDDNGTPDDPSDDYYIGGRAPAIQNLVLAAQEGYQQEAAHYLSQGEVSSLDAAAGRWGSIVEALTTAPPTADHNAAEAIDAQNQQLQGLIKNGIGMIPFSDLISNKDVNYLVGQAKGIGLTPTLEALLPTDGAAQAAEQIVDAHNLVEVQMRQSLYQVLSTDGVWTDGDKLTPSEWVEGNTSFLDPAGDIIPYDQMTKGQQESFRDFLTAQVAQGNMYGERIDNLAQALNDARLEREEAE